MDGDGWTWCARGHKHWGRYGAAGLLLQHGNGPATSQVLLQHRAEWSHHGGTWGVPGGARHCHESPVDAAVREAGEESSIDPARLSVVTVVPDEHGDWTYWTVVARYTGDLDVRPVGEETMGLRWVRPEAVTDLLLHPGFAETWPRLRALLM